MWQLRKPSFCFAVSLEVVVTSANGLHTAGSDVAVVLMRVSELLKLWCCAHFFVLLVASESLVFHEVLFSHVCARTRMLNRVIPAMVARWGNMLHITLLFGSTASDTLL